MKRLRLCFLNHSGKEAPVFRVSMYSAVINRFRIDSYQVCSQQGTKSVLLNKVVTSNSAVFSEWLHGGYVTFNSSQKRTQSINTISQLMFTDSEFKTLLFVNGSGLLLFMWFDETKNQVSVFSGITNSMAWFCIKCCEAFDDLGRSKSIMKFVASTFNNQFLLILSIDCCRPKRENFLTPFLWPLFSSFFKKLFRGAVHHRSPGTQLMPGKEITHPPLNQHIPIHSGAPWGTNSL